MTKTIIIVSTYPADTYYDEIKEHLTKLGYPFIFSGRETKRSFSENNNLGAKQATSEYVLFLNSDTIPEAGFIEAMEQALDKNKKIGVVGAKMVYLKDFRHQLTFRGRVHVLSGTAGTVQHAGIMYNNALLPYEIGKGLSPLDPGVNEAKIVGSVTGACMLVRRQEFLDLGGFDEKFINGWEDTDLCLRYLEKNGQLSYYEPKAEVGHYFAGATYTGGRFDKEDANFNYWMDKWHRSEKIFKLFMKPLKKLDVGCGGSKRKGYVGIDKYPDENTDIIFDLDLLMRNGIRLPFGDNDVDVIYCANVLQEVEDVVTVINEFHRILRSNGLLEIVVPHAQSWTAIANPFAKHFFLPETFTQYFGSDVIDREQHANYQMRRIAPWHIEKIDISAIPASVDAFDVDRTFSVFLRAVK